MKEFAAQNELEALASLRDHERELDQQLEEARLDAERVQADARRTADGLKQQADAELLEELEALRTESALRLERSLATVQDETRRRSEALRRTADQRRGQALDWILGRVAGRDQA